MPNLDDTIHLVDEEIIDEQTLQPRRAIRDGKQAMSVAKRLEQDNDTRNKTNATIWKKYNGGQPFDPAKLAASAETWRNNFPTGFLSGIVDRVVPAPVQIIDAARYLTSATLEAKDDPDASHKSEVFREKITRAIRQWDGWKDFCYSLSQENVLIGGAFAAWLDNDTPFPDFFRQDQLFLHDGTGQHAKMVPAFAVKKSYLLHEAIEFIKDGREIASAAGHDVDAWVEEINNSAPHAPDAASANSREYEDIIREGNMGMSYESGAKVVETYHLLVTEPDTQKVTHYILSARGEGKVLFQKDDRYEKMEDVLTLFTLQPGNGKFYGSKGLGRMLINMHIAIDRARNVMFDQVYLAGMKFIYTDAGKAPKIQFKVHNPFIIASGDGKFDQKQLVADVDGFLKLDAKLTQLAELTAGAYIPDKISGEDGQATTATEEKLQYAREQQAKIAFLARFWGQFANLVSCIQRRLCDPDSSHEVSKQVRKELKAEKLTDEDIKKLANLPAAEVVQDLTQVQNQQVSAVAQAYTGNPMIDQKELLKRNITAMSSPALADAIIIPEEMDKTVEAEAVRQQIIENAAIMVGESVPVSPRDRHDIHLKYLAEEMGKAMPIIAQKAQENSPEIPQLLDNYSAGMGHGQAHIEMWKQAGGDPNQIKQYEEGLNQAEDFVKQVAQHIQAQQEAQQAPEEAEVRPEGQGTGEPQGPPMADHMLKISSSIDYKTAPESIKRQIEAAAGFEPADTEQALRERATTAIESHPSLPVKMKSTIVGHPELPPMDQAQQPIPPEPQAPQPTGP